MQRLSGRLREVVVYKNQTTRGLFQEEAQARLLHGRMSKVPCCSLYILIVHTASENASSYTFLVVHVI